MIGLLFLGSLGIAAIDLKLRGSHTTALGFVTPPTVDQSPLDRLGELPTVEVELGLYPPVESA